jgi:hypothetical protein
MLINNIKTETLPIFEVKSLFVLSYISYLDIRYFYIIINVINVQYLVIIVEIYENKYDFYL